ncbi:MAG: ATP-dependent RecD-like DNA helicase [Candidatus Bipolaricaulia bacterium]
MKTLRGTLERIVYENEETGYTVARLSSPQHRTGLITVVGNLASATPGEHLLLEGWWTNHPKYGRQFKIEAYRTVAPTTVAGIKKYLGSGLINGIGPVMADRITNHFGLHTLEVIETDPKALKQVHGIGPKRIRLIIAAWNEQKEIQEVMLFLKTYDVSTTYAIKIYKTYGQDAISIIQENPYRLAEDIFGIGFKTADQIAARLGLAKDAPGRLRAGIEYLLYRASDEGHVYLPRSQLMDRCMEMLEVEVDKLQPALDTLVQADKLVVDEETEAGAKAVYLTPFYYAEVGVANRMRRISSTTLNLHIDRDRGHSPLFLPDLERRVRLEYSPKQQEAIANALTCKVLILTGGPGTGKTTTVRGIIQLFDGLGLKIALASPTGRAAKRLSQATGRDAKTIHRLLGYAPHSGFAVNDRNPLNVDVIIIDEASMIDLTLMNNLLKAIRPTATLILIGDVDQLPSVGAGNVLRDLIDSRTVEVIELKEIFRQARHSQIITNAHRINDGKFPDLTETPHGDFRFVEEEDPQRVAVRIEAWVTERLPNDYGYDPFADIQVLSPMYRGAAGADRLNQQLQEQLNPDSGEGKRIELPYVDKKFRLGDKVMQIRNNYEKEVFNGDIGRVVAVDRAQQQVQVHYPDRGRISYALTDLDELVLAYAITIHKSQGNEYPAVVFPLLTQHYLMLQRNLLYTAVTRAQQLVVLVGSKKAVGIAVNNDKPVRRYSKLKDRLRDNEVRYLNHK